MLLDKNRLVNLDQMCDWIEANTDLIIDSVNNGSGMQPITEQPYNAVLK